MFYLAYDGPAGGAPTQDLIAASIVGLIGLALAVFVAYRYRKGKMAPLRWASATSERIGGLPSWSVLPSLVAGISLLIAVFGFYWDVSTHIDNGRDSGPFANPAHWFILIGLLGITTAGYLALLLGDRKASPYALRAGTWTISLGGGLVLLCGLIALAGFPLDDVWHRLFGQDVTLWGPTHIQMVGGASLTTLCMWVLFRETEVGSAGKSWARRMLSQRETFIAGAFLLGLSTLQGEFDFGVPQFNLLYHPILVMLAAGIGLTTARVRLGRGGAVKAVTFFLVARVILWLLVGPILGRIDLHFPLYMAEALLVEAIALRVSPTRPLRFALVSGAAVGTIGLAAEWGWSHLWMPIPWPAALFPEAAVFGLIAAVSGALIGTWIGRALAQTKDQRLPRWTVAAATLIAIGCIAYPAGTTSRAITADVELSGQSTIDGDPHAFVTVHLQPSDAAEDALWFHALAYQGKDWRRGESPIIDMIETEPGTYMSADLVPVGAGWKTMVRLHAGRSIMALPIFLPADTGIPAEEVSASQSFTRSFGDDKAILQREAVGGNAGLQRVGYGLLALIAFAWLASITVALIRFRRGPATRRKRLPEESVQLHRLPA